MMRICESELPTSQFVIQEPCEVCHRQFVRRSSVLRLEGRQIVITVVYELCIKPLGFSLGRHVYSTTLLPGEEVELEIFRSFKRSEEISREYSTEESFSQEFASTVQEEWSTKENSNFKVGGGVSASLDLGIFKIGAHAEPEYTTSTEEFHKAFVGFSTKTSAKVDRKFDLHIDVKSEATESTRSTRRIRNLNQCQTVTYHYFQIARRYLNTLTVVDVRFDVVPPRQSPPILYAAPLRALLVDYRVEPPRPNEVLARRVITPIEGAAGFRPVGIAGAPLAAATVDATAPTGGVLAASLVHPVVGTELARPVRELTLAQILSELGLRNAQAARLRERVERLLDQLGLKPGNLVSRHETCVNTTSLYADAVTGVCAACDSHTVEIQRLEKEKLAAEVKRLKLSVASFNSVIGYVRSAAGGVEGTTVSLLGPGGETLAQEVTDGTGFYGVGVGALLTQGDSYTVRVTAIPPPFTAASEPPAFAWGGQQVHVDFTLS